ncbi:MAG: hypothetical protein IJ658_11685 [Kiritimatiellae bacterium]|nr:hypothetical protein [Kiritimatiellia bacterium]
MPLTDTDINPGQHNKIGSVKRPLMLGVTSTTASLAKYYLGKTKELALPSFV